MLRKKETKGEGGDDYSVSIVQYMMYLELSVIPG